MRLDRREFVRGALATALAFGASSCVRSALSRGTVAGDGPYGPLGPPDANGIALPAGFTSRLLATSGDVVAGSDLVWHEAPDGGACFASVDGGWVYVSNSEVADGGGGASALRFAADGSLVGAHRVLAGTSRNCAGGATVAGTWLSCEENGANGQVYECDPHRTAAVLRPALGSFNHEAAAEDPLTRAIYLSEDDPVGRLYRFVPSRAGDLAAGELFAAAVDGGVVTWVPTATTRPDRQPRTTPFAGGEGLCIEGRSLMLTTKYDRRVWELDLDEQTIAVLYDAAVTPDAALDAVDNCASHTPSGDLYVCEDGGNMEVCLIAAADGDRPRVVSPFLRIEGHADSEWCGIAFSPDQRRIYLSSQRGSDGRGRTYEIAGPFRSPVVEVPLVGFGATWRASVTAAPPPASWTSAGFDDGSWVVGAAPLGYGDPVATVLTPGGTPSDRPITAWFRHVFTVAGTEPVTDLTLRIRRDDGAVVHLDGSELTRTNMPAGPVTAATHALSSTNDAAETEIHTIALPGRILAPGTHVLAVEVHQYQPSSSDLTFDLALAGRTSSW